MSVEVICDDEKCSRVSDYSREPVRSPFMGETYAGGRYVYTLPNGWTRDDEGHYCPACSDRRFPPCQKCGKRDCRGSACVSCGECHNRWGAVAHGSGVCTPGGNR